MPTKEIKVVLMRMPIISQGARISLISLWNGRNFYLVTILTTYIDDEHWTDARLSLQQRRRLNFEERSFVVGGWYVDDFERLKCVKERIT